MRISRQSYFVTQLISQQDTGIAQLHCQSVLQLLHVSRQVMDVSAMTSGHWSLGHLVVPTNVNLLVVLLCHTVHISARSKHCTIALPISATIITDISVSYRRLGDDQWTSIFRASCSADQCKSLGSLTLSHSSYLGTIQALHNCIANQRYNYYRCVGEDQWPSVFRASCSADRCESLGGLTLSHGEYPGEIQALQDSIVNQDNHCDRHLGADVSAHPLPSVLRASCSADRGDSPGGLTLSHS